MPIAKRKPGHLHQEPDLEEQYEPPRKRNNAKSKNSKASGKTKNSPQVTIDKGRQSNRDFMAAAASGRTRHDAVKTSENKIRKQTNDLIAFVGSGVAGAVEEKDIQMESLLKGIPAAFKASASNNSELSSKTDDDVFSQALIALRKYRAVVEQYQAISTKTTEIEKPQLVRWEQDCRDLSLLREKALSFAADTVNAEMRPSITSEPVKGPSGVDNDVERLAWEWFEDTRATQSKKTWGRIALAFVHRVEALAGLIPE